MGHAMIGAGVVLLAQALWLHSFEYGIPGIVLSFIGMLVSEDFS